MDPRSAGLRFFGPPRLRAVDPLKERSPDGTALAGTLDRKQASVDRRALLDELGRMGRRR